MKYKHTQIGKIFIAVLILSIIITMMSITTMDFQKYSPDWMDASNWDVYGIVIVSIVYLLILNMSTLSIAIDKESLRWHFGVGFPKKTIQLDTINTVKQVRNKWYYGFGIRKLVSGGWLYNVHGLDAIEVVTKQGKKVRLGTDDPKGLARALSMAVEKRKVKSND